MRGKQKGSSYKVEKAPAKNKTLRKAPLKEYQRLESIKAKGFGPFKKDIKMRYRHFLEPEVRTTKFGRPKASGWHHDPNGLFEKKKIFNGSEIQILGKQSKSNGVYRFEWCFKGGPAKKSTFFPKTWSRKTALNKVKEAFNYCKKYRTMPKFDKIKQNYVLEGFTKEGIKIKMVIEKNEIITAYPIIT